jgi:ATP-binding cassette subfamily B protein
VPESPSTTRRLLALARPQLPLLAVATVALVISSGLSLVYPQVVRWMVDLVVVGEDLSLLNQVALVLVVLFLIQSVFTMLRAWLFTVAGERVVRDLRVKLYEAIIRQDMAFFDRGRTGELTNRLASDTTVLQNTVTVNLSMGLRYLIGAVGGSCLLLWMSPFLAIVALAVVPVVAFAAAALGRKIRKLSRKMQDALADSTVVAEETFAGVRTVRTFAREDAEVVRYNEAVSASYRIAATRALAVGSFHGLAGFAGYAAVAVVVWMGGRMVMTEQMTMGELTAFLLYTLMVAVSLGALAGLYADFMKAIGSSQRVFELIDRVSPLEGSEGPDLTEVKGAIRLEGVSFAYPARPDVVVLEDLDLELKPGEVVALVGPSGAGKSTVAQLLSRLYDPQSGRITVDGQDIREVSPASLRRQVGVVSQEPMLFATTIADNIRYGRTEASLEQVRAAAEAANALGFVEAFPEGFDTLVGERGIQLSGGQKQRIAIARALLKDPAILVLDEATSALDTESEHLVQEALERLMQGRTTLIIAHRLSTVQGANRVVVLDGGRVQEQGTHGDLMAAKGLYHRLVERQFLVA